MLVQPSTPSGQSESIILTEEEREGIARVPLQGLKGRMESQRIAECPGRLTTLPNAIHTWVVLDPLVHTVAVEIPLDELGSIQGDQCCCHLDSNE